jgi:hypothetical protein
MSDWTPAIIAPHEHVAALHTGDPSEVTKYAGTKVRVRESQEARDAMDVTRKLLLGCPGYSVEMHPEDAEQLWPELTENGTNVTVCTCVLLMD